MFLAALPLTTALWLPLLPRASLKLPWPEPATATATASCTAAVLDNELGNLTTQAGLESLVRSRPGQRRGQPRLQLPAHHAEHSHSSARPTAASGQNTSGIAQNATIGYGNYNGAFVSVGLRNWHGLTMQHNLTWSKALGTGAVVQASSEYTPNDPFNLGAMYGEQPFDQRIVYNTYLVADDPWFKAQHGLLGRVAGGWTLAPIFTAGSGGPVLLQHALRYSGSGLRRRRRLQLLRQRTVRLYQLRTMPATPRTSAWPAANGVGTEPRPHRSICSPTLSRSLTRPGSHPRHRHQEPRCGSDHRSSPTGTWM